LHKPLELTVQPGDGQSARGKDEQLEYQLTRFCALAGSMAPSAMMTRITAAVEVNEARILKRTCDAEIDE
jgi:hypothetical protein